MENLNLPVVNDDLQHHAVGCYTAESEIKKGNRQAEAALVTAEKIASVALAMLWAQYILKMTLLQPGKRYSFFSFMTVLQAHHCLNIPRLPGKDTAMLLILPIPTAYMSLQKLEWQVASEDPASQYLMVFNPHAWEVNSTS